MSIRTCLFGGSFNPLHEGHLALADTVLQQGLADEVWFVVSPRNPLKPTADPADAALRLEAARIALKDRPRCVASDIEFGLPTPNYFIQTLRKAMLEYPSREFLLLIGGDNLDVFTKWKDYEWLLENVDIMVYPRPGASNVVPAEWSRVKMLNGPLMEVSSTEIRRQLGK